MSKWLRRGFGNSNSHNHHHSTESSANNPGEPHHLDFTPPQTAAATADNDMTSAAAAAAYQPPPSMNHHHHYQQQSPNTTAPMDKYGAAASNTGSGNNYAARQYDDPRQQQQQRRSNSRDRRTTDAATNSRMMMGSTPVPPFAAGSRVAAAGAMLPGHFGGAAAVPGSSVTPQPEHHPQHAIVPPHNHPHSSSGMHQPSFPPPAVTSDTPPPPTEQRRPAYLLHRDLVIGKGSYGQVCIASRGEPEGHSGGRSGKRKKFACKCVMLRNDPKYIAKLQEEVNVLRELRGHDNVIRLYDVFCVDNELFIITELGRGGDLFHLLTTHPKHGVTEQYAAKTVAEMLSAVAFLHARSICHRDLKLENWVLESGKDVWSPLKLIDFGLSTHFTSGQRLSRVVGSSYYVAPEVLKKSYTEACDLWSLGVIVYMLLSGAPPFYGKNDEAIKASIVQGEYTFPHELFRDVSDQAMAFVSTLLSYNIEYRYTAEQALTHTWLAENCDAQALQKAKDGARGHGIQVPTDKAEPMQL